MRRTISLLAALLAAAGTAHAAPPTGSTFHAVPCQITTDGRVGAAYAVPLADLVEVTCTLSLNDDVADPDDDRRSQSIVGSVGVLASTFGQLPPGADVWLCTSAWWAYRGVVGGGSGSDGPHCAKAEPIATPVGGAMSPCLFTTFFVDEATQTRDGRVDAAGVAPGGRSVLLTCTVRNTVTKDVVGAVSDGPRGDFALVSRGLDIPVDVPTEICGRLTWRDANFVNYAYDAGCVPTN